MMDMANGNGKINYWEFDLNGINKTSQDNLSGTKIQHITMEIINL